MTPSATTLKSVSSGKMNMDINLVSVAVLQILAVGAIAGAILLYLLRFRRTPPLLDIGHKSVFITHCESVIGYECAKRMDRLGLRVFAGVSRLNSEKAESLKKEASDKLHLVEFDAGNCEKMDKAVEYVHQCLPTDEEGE